MCIDAECKYGVAGVIFVAKVSNRCYTVGERGIGVIALESDSGFAVYFNRQNTGFIAKVSGLWCYYGFIFL